MAGPGAVSHCVHKLPHEVNLVRVALPRRQELEEINQKEVFRPGLPVSHSGPNVIQLYRGPSRRVTVRGTNSARTTTVRATCGRMNRTSGSEGGGERFLSPPTQLQFGARTQYQFSAWGAAGAEYRQTPRSLFP